MEAEMIQWLVGGGAGGGGLAAGMLVQQILAKKNGHSVTADLAELKVQFENIENRMGRFETRLDQALDRGN
jgi:hypothetical protein